MSSNKKINITELVESLVARVEFHHYEQTRTISCALTLGNGFTVVGTAHALPTTEFSLQLGSDLARADANNKVAELLAFVISDASCNYALTNHINNYLANALKEPENEHG